MSKDFSISDYFRLILLNDNDRALLDTASGLIVLNTTVDTYIELAERDKSLQNKHNLLDEILTHEFIHCLQFVCCGYPYKFVCELWSVIEKRYKLNRPQSLRDTISVLTDEDIDKINQILNLFDRDINGVSAASICESSALLAQKRRHYPNLSPSTYNEHLNKNYLKNSPYRVAFDFANERFAPLIFEIFQPLAFVSLCASEPAETFTTLCEHCIIPKYTTPHSALKLFKDCARRHNLSFLGDARAAIKNFNLYHPFFYSAVYRLAWLQYQDFTTATRLFSEPQTFSDQHVEELCMPLLFRRQGSKWPYKFFDGMRRGLEYKKMENQLDQMMCMSATLAGLLKPKRGLEFYPSVLEKLSQKDPILYPIQQPA